MSPKVWRYTCNCVWPGGDSPTCPSCGQAGEYDIPGILYSRRYGLAPFGPQRELADRLFQGAKQTCEQCAGTTMIEINQGEDWEFCRTCNGLGIIFTRSRKEIEAIRRMVLELFPDAATTQDENVRFQSPTEKDKPDLGLEVLDFLFESMGIDEQWGVREYRSFTWWGHRLAQRV